jgi:hypothetical protein
VIFDPLNMHKQDSNARVPDDQADHVHAAGFPAILSEPARGFSMAPGASGVAGATLFNVIRVPIMCAAAPQSSVLLFAPPPSLTFSYPKPAPSLWGMPVLKRPGATRTTSIQGRKTLAVRANAGREAKIETRRTVAGTRCAFLATLCQNSASTPAPQQLATAPKAMHQQKISVLLLLYSHGRLQMA